MSYQTLTIQREDYVMVINMVSLVDNQAEMARLPDELSDLCDKTAWDDMVRVIVLTGAGEKFYSMETDLIGLFSRINEEQQIKVLSFAEPIAKLGQPVIAAINGDAIGQGLELALSCDIRIAVEASRFGLPHVKEGLIPWGGGTQRLSRLVVILTGRADDMIIRGGENISPEEVEEVLQSHPRVEEAAVIGVSDPEWGEQPRAVVVLKRGERVTEEELVEYCRTRLAGFKRPRSVVFIDALPRNPMGKVLRKRLREEYGRP